MPSHPLLNGCGCILLPHHLSLFIPSFSMEAAIAFLGGKAHTDSNQTYTPQRLNLHGTSYLDMRSCLGLGPPYHYIMACSRTIMDISNFCYLKNRTGSVTKVKHNATTMIKGLSNQPHERYDDVALGWIHHQNRGRGLDTS